MTKWREIGVGEANRRALQALQAARVRPYFARLRVMAKLIDAPVDRTLTASELHRELVCAHTPMALSSVYASLKVLAEHGLVQGCDERPGAYRLAPGVGAPSSADGVA
ncbi:MAG: hypothetical protein ACOZE7_08365 [Pseudomonadota bacterium]